MLVVGSLTRSYYGITESADSLDLVVELAPAQVESLSDQLGSTFTRDPEPTFDVATGARTHVFRVVWHAFIVRLFELSTDPFDRERYARQRPVKAYGCTVGVPTAEDVIVQMLRDFVLCGDGREWDDVRAIMAVQGGQLDWAYLESRCDRHGSSQPLAEIRVAAKV
jgi:hypothetical protein